MPLQYSNPHLNRLYLSDSHFRDLARQPRMAGTELLSTYISQTEARIAILEDEASDSLTGILASGTKQVIERLEEKVAMVKEILEEYTATIKDAMSTYWPDADNSMRWVDGDYGKRTGYMNVGGGKLLPTD